MLSCSCILSSSWILPISCILSIFCILSISCILSSSCILPSPCFQPTSFIQPISDLNLLYPGSSLDLTTYRMRTALIARPVNNQAFLWSRKCQIKYCLRNRVQPPSGPSLILSKQPFLLSFLHTSSSHPSFPFLLSFLNTSSSHPSFLYLSMYPLQTLISEQD